MMAAKKNLQRSGNTAFLLSGLFAMLLFVLSSCEKKFDIALQPNQQQVVVEAYINNEIPAYNYVVLSRSQDYYAPNFQSIPVENAIVTITEGIRQPDFSYSWDMASKTQMTELNLDAVPPLFRKGVYFDAKLFLNPSQALTGKTGKYYLLEILADGKQYSSITQVMEPVLIDSLSSGYPFVDDDNNNKLRITVNYQDPDTLGNAQFYFWRFKDNRNNFGWAGLTRSRAPGIDDLTNGEYIQLTSVPGFDVGDTVNYYMASVPRDVYRFWDSYNKARNNNGPFSTPITLLTNINGEGVTGCFSGFSISSKAIILK